MLAPHGGCISTDNYCGGCISTDNFICVLSLSFCFSLQSSVCYSWQATLTFHSISNCNRLQDLLIQQRQKRAHLFLIFIGNSVFSSLQGLSEEDSQIMCSDSQMATVQFCLSVLWLLPSTFYRNINTDFQKAFSLNSSELEKYNFSVCHSFFMYGS